MTGMDLESGSGGIEPLHVEERMYARFSLTIIRNAICNRLSGAPATVWLSIESSFPRT